MYMKDFLRNTWKHRAHVVMALPAFLILFFIMYVPMTGVCLAFKDYKTSAGIFGSDWNGLENFKFLIASKRIFLRMTRNTLIYYVIFTAVGTVLNVALAVAIDQCVFKKATKTMQTIMIIPVFISYVAVQFIANAFLHDQTGIINNTFGTDFRFFTDAGVPFWPLILTIIKIWKDTGYGAVLYMSVLAGVDSSLYEAAEIDGASKWQKIWHISLPALIPMITVMLLLSVGSIMKSDTGLFYQVTRNVGAIHETTQVIDSYVFHAVKTSNNIGFTAATSLFQSVTGLLLMLFANGVVRKVHPDNALF